ncbi:hypothetical protein [Mycolicibacterium sp. HK-90]|uniref:hypothetical protein n=1 Tax=Mycolicibacterium sp. HK-90 TaxID=3056937 RepID=UPI002658CAEC|nr:hypothetical protein [Mycolicibacterium sp. HK-90]WKG06019.1 hypothetical protein QU592_13470 [Mycolicibacterium sp. HK-90]
MAATGLEVRLHQGRERAEVSKFARTLDEIVLSLREVDQVYLLRGTRATWVLDRVEHQRDDLVVRLGPRNVPSGRDVSDMMVPVQALVDGAEVLQEHAAVPELFAPKTVTRLAKLATPTGGVQGVSLATYNGKTRDLVELDNAVRDNAIAAVNPIQIAYGSVTGTLSALRHVQRRQGGVQVTVRDDLERRAITGVVGESQAEQLRPLWRHRVQLSGIIKRNGSGQAIRIDVDSIEQMPEDNSGRPSTAELLGVASGWLGDMTVDDYIAELRNG